MPVHGISSHQSQSHWQHLAGATTSGSAASRGATDAIANTGSISAGNMDAFFQSFSTDLQSALSQPGKNAGAAIPPNTGLLAANRPLPHQHHQHQSGDGTLQGGTNQMVTRIDQALRAYGASVAAA